MDKFCGLIYRIRHMFPGNCLLMFYNSYAKSLINYGTIAFGGAAKTNLSKIEMAQRRTLRAIFFKKKMDSKTDVLREKGISTVYEFYLSQSFWKSYSDNLGLKPPKPIYRKLWKVILLIREERLKDYSLRFTVEH